MKILGDFTHSLRFALVALCCATCSVSHAWGPQGHRVAGTLTEAYLAPETRQAISSLLGDESLAGASTWADRMRSSPSPFWQKQAGPYHYVTVRSGKSYRDIGAPRKGDSVTALAEFRSTLQNPGASRAHRQLALRFSLHIIQDLHQPLHVGNGNDRGGNDVKVEQGGKTTNLHRVWDSGILRATGRSDKAWVTQLRIITPQTAASWATADPMIWIAESAKLRDQIYPESRVITDSYVEAWLPTIEMRLQQSAVRSAAWLNEVLAPPVVLPNP